MEREPDEAEARQRLQVVTYVSGIIKGVPSIDPEELAQGVAAGLGVPVAMARDAVEEMRETYPASLRVNADGTWSFVEEQHTREANMDLFRGLGKLPGRDPK